MSIEEFSSEFDVLINSYAHKIPYGDQLGDIALDEYEKSVFLTKAQEQIVTELYNGKNRSLDSFEKNEETRRSLSKLVETYSVDERLPQESTLFENSVMFEIPDDVMDITYEQLKVQNITDECKDVASILLEVVPVTQDELIRTSQNPFKGVNRRRAFRLDLNDFEQNEELKPRVEIVTKYNDPNEYKLTYTIRYLKHPEPIILINLSDSNLSINNKREEKGCKLSPNLHRQILERAVLLALASKGGKV